MTTAPSHDGYMYFTQTWPSSRLSGICILEFYCCPRQWGPRIGESPFLRSASTNQRRNQQSPRRACQLTPSRSGQVTGFCHKCLSRNIAVLCFFSLWSLCTRRLTNLAVPDCPTEVHRSWFATLLALEITGCIGKGVYRVTEYTAVELSLYGQDSDQWLYRVVCKTIILCVNNHEFES